MLAAVALEYVARKMAWMCGVCAPKVMRGWKTYFFLPSLCIKTLPLIQATSVADMWNAAGHPQNYGASRGSTTARANLLQATIRSSIAVAEALVLDTEARWQLTLLGL